MSTSTHLRAMPFVYAIITLLVAGAAQAQTPPDTTGFYATSSKTDLKIDVDAPDIYNDKLYRFASGLSGFPSADLYLFETSGISLGSGTDYTGADSDFPTSTSSVDLNYKCENTGGLWFIIFDDTTEIAYLNVVDNGGDPMTLKWYCLAGSGEHCEGSSNNRIVVPSSSYLFFEYQSDCDSLPSSPTVKSLVTSLDK